MMVFGRYFILMMAGASDYLSIFSLTGNSSGPRVIWVAIELAITSALVSQIYEILMFLMSDC